MSDDVVVYVVNGVAYVDVYVVVTDVGCCVVFFVVNGDGVGDWKHCCCQ